MQAATNNRIKVQTIVNASPGKTWKAWITPEDIMQWNSASPDWHTPRAENDLRPGGTFSSRMEAKDGSFGFDFGGTYDEVKHKEFISYTMSDGRKVEVTFRDLGGKTEVTELFDAEQQNSEDLQRTGWQAILDNFKKYVESAGG